MKDDMWILVVLVALAWWKGRGTPAATAEATVARWKAEASKLPPEEAAKLLELVKALLPKGP